MMIERLARELMKHNAQINEVENTRVSHEYPIFEMTNRSSHQIKKII